jgi:hypothetical protein
MVLNLEISVYKFLKKNNLKIWSNKINKYKFYHLGPNVVCEDPYSNRIYKEIKKGIYVDELFLDYDVCKNEWKKIKEIIHVPEDEYDYYVIIDYDSRKNINAIIKTFDDSLKFIKINGPGIYVAQIRNYIELNVEASIFNQTDSDSETDIERNSNAVFYRRSSLIIEDEEENSKSFIFNIIKYIFSFNLFNYFLNAMEKFQYKTK